jgi:hypothetical protein
MSCPEAVNHSTINLTSILNVYKVFEHLHMMWMGTWVHPYKVTPVQEVGAKFGNLRVRMRPSNIMVSCLEAANHPTLYLTSILNVYEALSTFICCGWACGCTLTLLHLCRWGLNIEKLEVSVRKYTQNQSN